jgi:hypothetical protein
VLLLCYSIDNVIRQQLAKQYRVACPRGRILAITNAPFEYPPVEADAFLYGVEGAEALITAVSQVQKETGNSPKDGADAAAEAGEK